MDSNLESLEKQVADLNRRFQTLENLIHMLQRSQPAVVAYGGMANGFGPKHPDWNQPYPMSLKNETQLKWSSQIY